jgi:hypothetical protein
MNNPFGIKPVTHEYDLAANSVDEGRRKATNPARCLQDNHAIRPPTGCLKRAAGGASVPLYRERARRADPSQGSPSRRVGMKLLS